MVNAYPIQYKWEVLLLLLAELSFTINWLRKYYRNFIVESRSIIGFVYDSGGIAKARPDGMFVKFKKGDSVAAMVLRWKSSDFLVFNQVFIKEEYKPLTKLSKINPVVIDAGANIGCTAIYFSMFYPKAEIIAIEPEISNFQQMVKNIALSNLNVISIQAALWHCKGTVSIAGHFGDKRNWSMKVDDSQKGGIVATTLQSVLQTAKIDQVDILKLDIEGAEEFLFKKDNSFVEILRFTKTFAIEVHDKESDIPNILEKMGFQPFTLGETLFVLNNLL
jgi:FkbM family methyltransferase